MRKLIVFNSISLDGYFVDNSDDMSWAHSADPEFNAFIGNNASGTGELLFGRITYDLMVSYWPTPQAAANDPVVAAGMNQLPKIVFSRTMERADWQNTRLIKGDVVPAVEKLKAEPGPLMVIMGSGSIVSQLTQAGLIDEFQFVVVPVVLGAGRTLFAGCSGRRQFNLLSSRSFANGNLFVCYQPKGGQA